MSSNAEAAMRERERQREHEQAMAGLNSNGKDVHQNILEDITETDALPPASRKLLKNLITKDWVLANLRDKDYNEIKWEIEIMKLEFLAMHPAGDSLLQGDYRAAVYDDESELKTALSDHQKAQVNQFFRLVRLRLTRSRGFRQQEIINTDISRTEVERPSEQTNGGLMNRFS